MKFPSEISYQLCRANSDKLFYAIDGMIDRRSNNLDLIQLTRLLKPNNISKLSIDIGIPSDAEYNIKSIENSIIQKFEYLQNNPNTKYAPLVLFDNSNIRIIFSDNGILLFDSSNQSNTNYNSKKIYTFRTGFLKFIDIQEIRKFNKHLVTDEADDQFLKKLFEYLKKIYIERLRNISLTRPDYLMFKQSTKTKYRRITHCWHCKSGLDNDQDVECEHCDWIICPKCFKCDPECKFGEENLGQ